MGSKVFYIILAIWLLSALVMLIVGFGLRFGWYDVSYFTLHAGEQKKVTNFGTTLFCSQVTVTAPSVNDKFSAALLDTYLNGRQNGREQQQFRRPYHLYIEPGEFKPLTLHVSNGALLQLAACSPTLVYMYTFVGNDENPSDNADQRFAVMNLLRQQRLEDTFAYQKPLRIFQPPDDQTLASNADDSIRSGSGGCRAGDENHFLRDWERVTFESRPSSASTVYAILYAPPDSTRDYYSRDGLGAVGRRAAHVMLESHLTRAHFDTTHAFHRCDYTHHCAFALSLTAAANERVVVQLMDGYGPAYGNNLQYNYRSSKTSNDNNNNVFTRDGTLRGAEHDDAVFARTLTVRCSMVRWWFYVLLFGLIPLILLALVTAFMLRFRDRTVRAVIIDRSMNNTSPMKTSRNGIAYEKASTTVPRTNDVVVMHVKPVTRAAPVLPLLEADNVDKNSTTIDDQSSVGGVAMTSGDSGVETGGADLSDNGSRRPKIPPRPWKSRAGAVKVLPDILGTSTNDDEEVCFLPMHTENRLEVVPDEEAPPLPVPKKRSKPSDDFAITAKLPPPRMPPPALPQRPNKFVVNDRRWSTNLHDTSIRLLPANVINGDDDEENFTAVEPRKRISQDELKAKMAQRKSVAVFGQHAVYDEGATISPMENRYSKPRQQQVLTTEL